MEKKIPEEFYSKEIEFSFQYIFPAGGLLKSSPSTFVEIMLRKVKLKTTIFADLEEHFAGPFFLEVIFFLGRAILGFK